MKGPAQIIKIRIESNYKILMDKQAQTSASLRAEATPTATMAHRIQTNWKRLWNLIEILLFTSNTRIAGPGPQEMQACV